MPKLKRVARAKIPAISRHNSLKRFFGTAKPKFYSANKTIFAVASTPTQTSYRHVVIIKFDPKKKRFSRVLKAGLSPSKTFIDIGSLTVLPKKTYSKNNPKLGKMTFFAKQKTGFRLFRLVLNEAIAFAKEKHLKKISLFAQNKALEEYYASMGFELDPKSGNSFFYLK